jgi:outer membrane biosynthesis protein TonB
MLSVSQCQTQIPSSFFNSPFAGDLVYLDISDTPFSLKNALVQSAFGPQQLPSLRILKARSREMDDATASLLFETFKDQLRNLDLSHNRLTDAVIDHLLSFCFAGPSLRTDAHFDVEGRLIKSTASGSNNHGAFCFVEESEWSETFSHPDRHMADAPVYMRDEAAAPFAENHRVRHDGRTKIRNDSVEEIKQAVVGTVKQLLGEQIDDVRRTEAYGHAGGIRHLYLNENCFSARGIEKLLRNSAGHLEHFECDTTTLAVPAGLIIFPPWLAKTAGMSGLRPGGIAHLFRPVFSCNLQVMRVHHSLVTGVPALEAENVSTLARWWLAETFLRSVAEPVFEPDTNPRLVSLTLTGIPRQSSGPVIQALIRFLKLAAAQEQAIARVRRALPVRGPTMLRGLRHVRLEIEADPREQDGVATGSGDGNASDDGLEPEELITSAVKEFSFFGDKGWTADQQRLQSPTSATRSLSFSSPIPPPQVSPVPVMPPSPTPPSATLSPAPKENSEEQKKEEEAGPEDKTDDKEEKEEKEEEEDDQFTTYTGTWNGGAFGIPVWLGRKSRTPSTANASAVVAARYADLLELSGGKSALATEAEPATPSHLRAGVPPKSYVFGAAWDAASLVASIEDGSKDSDGVGIRRPARADLARMRDVVAAVREFRMAERRRLAELALIRKERRHSHQHFMADDEEDHLEEHYHWSGSLEVSMAQTDSASSRYWR